MKIVRSSAVMCVSSIDTAKPWYGRLLGRDPDRIPMPSLAEWDLTGGGWLQVFEDGEHAGSSFISIGVDSVEAAVTELEGKGLELDREGLANERFPYVRVADPDGNLVSFIEDRTGGS